MENESKAGPPVWFWIVSAVALVWNLMGVAAFVAQFAAAPAGPEAGLSASPLWYTIAFGVAVFGGALGCVALLLRKSWALWLFIASLVGVLAQQVYHFALSDIGANLGTPDMVMTLLIPVVGLLLIWLSRLAIGKGWIA